ncbi:unnamed protein product [Gongylonema pulchrum]|uniref:Inhibitor_I29 domain-containing protein n=1 Tax=Gongylonema pulchrum TaxID=637853 RepID=A0A183E6K6_9BILA|nr:unnamed protein product [Gongylonema pulchrum]
MAHVVIVLLVVCACFQYGCSQAGYSDLQIEKLYKKFLKKYPRDFGNDKTSYLERLKIFKENMHLIDASNSENTTAVFEVTRFADWTDEEFNAFSGPLVDSNRVYRNDEDGWIQVSWDGSNYPPHWDWRDYEGVTAIKTQS